MALLRIRDADNVIRHLKVDGNGLNNDPFILNIHEGNPISNIGIAAGSDIIGATKDAGPNQAVTRTYTTSADMSTAAAITASPASGQKIVATDIIISVDTAMNFSVQMETSANVLAKVYLPTNGTAQISLRGYLKGDAADKKLFGKASVSGNVAITVIYFSEA